MEKEIMDAVLYGMGYVCGKHNLNVSEEERTRVANEWVKRIVSPLPTDEEIDEAAHEHRPLSKSLDHNIGRNNWIWGAKWMRAKVQGDDAKEYIIPPPRD